MLDLFPVPVYFWHFRTLEQIRSECSAPNPNQKTTQFHKMLCRENRFHRRRKTILLKASLQPLRTKQPSYTRGRKDGNGPTWSINPNILTTCHMIIHTSAIPLTPRPPART